MSTQDLISAISNGEYTDAEAAFNGIMADKVSDALDAKRAEISKSMFSTEEEAEATETETPEVSADAEEAPAEVEEPEVTAEAEPEVAETEE